MVINIMELLSRDGKVDRARLLAENIVASKDLFNSLFDIVEAHYIEKALSDRENFEDWLDKRDCLLTVKATIETLSTVGSLDDHYYE